MNSAVLQSEEVNGSAMEAAPWAPPSRARRRERRGVAYSLAFVFAALVHGGILFAMKDGMTHGPEFSVMDGDSSVEVTLVAAPPAGVVAEPPSEPLVEKLPPEPAPLPPPEPVVEQMVISEPTPVATPRPSPPSKPAVREKKPATTQRTAAPAPAAVGDGSSAVPGRDATTARTSSGDRAKPGYLRNPHPAYPEEARRARQEGLVQLRVRVDAGGGVISASVTRSSGFPLLDERALSTVRDRWSFKPARVAGVGVSSEVIIPIRFSLRD